LFSRFAFAVYTLRRHNMHGRALKISWFLSDSCCSSKTGQSITAMLYLNFKEMRGIFKLYGFWYSFNIRTIVLWRHVVVVVVVIVIFAHKDWYEDTGTGLSEYCGDAVVWQRPYIVIFARADAPAKMPVGGDGGDGARKYTRVFDNQANRWEI